MRNVNYIIAIAILVILVILLLRLVGLSPV